MFLAGISDETGGFLFPMTHKPEGHDHACHNLLLTDSAVASLTGLEPNIFNHQPSDEGDRKIEVRLGEIKQLMLWRRVTFVVGWTSIMEEDAVEAGRVIVLEMVT
jgi:hypothetical protein